MIIFTPNTVIKSADINTNFEGLTTLQETYIRQVLASTFNSTASATWQDTGLKITLPSVGTYLIMCDLRLSNGASANDYAIVRLYNQTTSTAIANSDRLSPYPTANLQNTIPLTDIVTTASVDNIVRVDLKPSPAHVAGLYSDTNGYSVMIAKRIA